MADIEYFNDTLTSDRRANELATEPRPVVGTLCNFVPDELIIAAGCIPVRLDAGTYDTVGVADQVILCDACPVAKSTVGQIAQGGPLVDRLNLIVVPSSCDARRKMADILAAMPGRKVHVMVLPPSKTEPMAREAWLDEVLGLRDRLEELTGKRIGRVPLTQAVKLVNRRHKAFRRLHMLRRHDPPPLSGEEFLRVVNASFVDDAHRWTEQVERLCDEIERELQARGAQPAAKRPRVLLTGAPVIYPNLKLVQIIEHAGAVIVADDLCSGTERLYHPVVPAEWSELALLRAIAEKAVLPSTCPCFVESADRVNRLLELAEQFEVDGAVYHNLRMCVLFDVETKPVAEALEGRGIPLLRVQSDYTQEDEEQLRTRVEAFLEMLSRRFGERDSNMVVKSGGLR